MRDDLTERLGRSSAVLWRAMDQMESVKGAERKGGKQADAASVAAVEQQWISMFVLLPPAIDLVDLAKAPVHGEAFPAQTVRWHSGVQAARQRIHKACNALMSCNITVLQGMSVALAAKLHKVHAMCAVTMFGVVTAVAEALWRVLQAKPLSSAAQLSLFSPAAAHKMALEDAALSLFSDATRILVKAYALLTLASKFGNGANKTEDRLIVQQARVVWDETGAFDLLTHARVVALAHAIVQHPRFRAAVQHPPSLPGQTSSDLWTDPAPWRRLFFVAYTNNELGRRMWTLMSLTQLHELSYVCLMLFLAAETQRTYRWAEAALMAARTVCCIMPDTCHFTHNEYFGEEMKGAPGAPTRDAVAAAFGDSINVAVHSERGIIQRVIDLLRDAPTMFHSTNLSGCWSKEALVVSASGVEVLLSFQAQTQNMKGMTDDVLGTLTATTKLVSDIIGPLSDLRHAAWLADIGWQEQDRAEERYDVDGPCLVPPECLLLFHQNVLQMFASKPFRVRVQAEPVLEAVSGAQFLCQEYIARRRRTHRGIDEVELTSSRASAGLHFIADVLCDGAGALAATSNVLDYLLQRDEELQLLVEQDAFVPYEHRGLPVAEKSKLGYGDVVEAVFQAFLARMLGPVLDLAWEVLRRPSEVGQAALERRCLRAVCFLALAESVGIPGFDWTTGSELIKRNREFLTSLSLTLCVIEYSCSTAVIALSEMGASLAPSIGRDLKLLEDLIKEIQRREKAEVYEDKDIEELLRAVRDVASTSGVAPSQDVAQVTFDSDDSDDEEGSQLEADADEVLKGWGLDGLRSRALQSQAQGPWKGSGSVGPADRDTVDIWSVD